MNGGCVIVGGGQAGARTAFELRSAGYQKSIILVGEESHPPYERPVLSKDMISDEHTEMTWVGVENDYLDADIQMLLDSKAVELNRSNRQILLDDGTAIGFDTLVLATGGVPRRLPVADPRICTLRTIEDALRIRALAGNARRAAIVGGGVIGLEVASTLRSMGVETSVIEQAPRLLGRGFPAALAAHLTELHKTAGTRIITSVTIGATRLGDSDITIDLDNGEHITCDFVVVGVGIEPNTELARQAGLEVNNGIVVDAHCRTSDHNIYAVGDCAIVRGLDGALRRMETWQNANLSAVSAAAAITGQEPKAPEVPWFWTDQLGLNVQLAGRFDEGAIIHEMLGTNMDSKLFLYVVGNRLAGVAAINAGREMGICRRLIQAGKEIDSRIFAAEQLDSAALQAVLKAKLPVQPEERAKVT